MSDINVQDLDRHIVGDDNQDSCGDAKMCDWCEGLCPRDIDGGFPDLKSIEDIDVQLVPFIPKGKKQICGDCLESLIDDLYRDIKKVQDILMQYTDPKPALTGIMAVNVAMKIIQALSKD